MVISGRVNFGYAPEIFNINDLLVAGLEEPILPPEGHLREEGRMFGQIPHVLLPQVFRESVDGGFKTAYRFLNKDDTYYTIQ